MTRFNPTARLLANLIALIPCALIYDPVTPGLLCGAALLAAGLTGALRRVRLTSVLPLLLFAASLVWMNAAWARIPGARPIGQFGPLVFSAEGLAVGISLGMRVLAIASFSLLFMAGIDPTDLMLSLVQQWRLSPRMAYSFLAALRFLPTLETELANIRAAHRVRGAGDAGWQAGLRRWYRYAIPLLAGAIRRAERTALAMEARGFHPGAPRTYCRTLLWRTRDTLFVAGTLAAVGGILALSAAMGWLNGLTRWTGF